MNKFKFDYNKTIIVIYCNFIRYKIIFSLTHIYYIYILIYRLFRNKKKNGNEDLMFL